MITQVNNVLQWAGLSETHMVVALIAIVFIMGLDFIQGVMCGQ